MIITEDVLRGMIRQNIQETIDIKYMQKMTEELMPYFKDVIAEERRRLEFHMILEGYDPALLSEGFWDTIKDVGITAGQMVGGGVGMAAGAIGTVKYAAEFQENIDGKEYEWLSPLIGLFFSMQALVFPMPAIGSIKVLLLGFVKGARDIMRGASGLAAKGVLKVFQMGAKWFGKAVELLGKGLSGIGKAIKAGGEAVVKLGEKIGGGKMLESVVKAMTKKMDWFLKVLKNLGEGLQKLGQTKITMEGAKTMLKNAFTGTGQVATGAKEVVRGAVTGTKVFKTLKNAKSIIKNYIATQRLLQGKLIGQTITGPGKTGVFTVKGVADDGMMIMLNPKGKQFLIEPANIFAWVPGLAAKIADDAFAQTVKGISAVYPRKRAIADFVRVTNTANMG